MFFNTNTEEAHVSIDLMFKYIHFQMVKSYCVSLLLLKAYQLLGVFIFPYDMQWFCCQHDILTVHLCVGGDGEILPSSRPPLDDST